MAADVFRNKKLYPLVTELIIIGIKTDTSLVFFYIILFCCSKKYHTKFNTLFCYENSKTRESFNKLSLTIHQILTFKTLWIFIIILSAYFPISL